MNITLANRPSVQKGKTAAYHRGSGTSYSAPMVAGAAALLRRAAPGAPIAEIRRALERGARRSSELRGRVQYGVLDVACSLRQLNARKRPDWQMLDIGPQPDLEAYTNFIASTATCREQPPQSEEYRLAMGTARVFDTTDEAERFPTMQRFIDTAKLEDGAGSASLEWQGRLIGGRVPWAGGRAVFPIRPGPLTPIAPPQRTVYTAILNAACSAPGYRISGITVAFANAIKPSGWLFPTDAQATTKRIQLAVALAKP